MIHQCFVVRCYEVGNFRIHLRKWPFISYFFVSYISDCCVFASLVPCGGSVLVRRLLHHDSVSATQLGRVCLYIYIYNTYFKFTKTKPQKSTRCPPCQMIGPHFEQLASETANGEFVKVDVDDAADVAEHCGIQAMPTFQFFKAGALVDELKGADLNGLRIRVAKHV